MFAENLLYLRHGLQIHTGPLSRPFYLKRFLAKDGLIGIKEDNHAAYCAIPLTSAPEILKPYIKQRQETLLDILQEAGITGYDPNSADLSPDKSLNLKPKVIYRVDKGKVASARFFTLLDLLPSTGVGVEEEVANNYNRIAVILHDKNIRTSRMQTNRSIHLEYNDLEEQGGQLVEVFRFLQGFKPGMGFDNGEPVLLGFQGSRVVNLEKEICEAFPDLRYEYGGHIPAIKLLADNPKILQ